MTCPHCGTVTPAGAVHCATCGAPQSPLNVKAGPSSELDVTAGVPGSDPFEPVIPGTQGFRTGTHQFDVDVTRMTPPAAQITAGPTQGPTRTGSATPRQFQMLTPGETLGA